MSNKWKWKGPYLCRRGLRIRYVDAVQAFMVTGNFLKHEWGASELDMALSVADGIIELGELGFIEWSNETFSEGGFGLRFPLSSSKHLN